MRNLNTVWSELFPPHVGQRIRVVSIIPREKEQRGAMITQGGFGIDMIGVEGTIKDIFDNFNSPYCFLVELDKSFTLEHSSTYHRNRLWLAAEEFEVIA